MSIGKHGEGRARLEQALAMDSTNIDVMVNLGVHFQEEGELDRARAYYARFALEAFFLNPSCIHPGTAYPSEYRISDAAA